MSFGAPPPTENCCVHCPSDRAKRDDPPKEKRLRRKVENDGPCSLDCPSHPKILVEYREVSPERDEIVAASLDWDATAATPDALLSVGALRLRRAVEAWKRAGRPQ